MSINGVKLSFPCGCSQRLDDVLLCPECDHNSDMCDHENCHEDCHEDCIYAPDHTCEAECPDCGNSVEYCASCIKKCGDCNERVEEVLCVNCSTKRAMGLSA